MISRTIKFVWKNKILEIKNPDPNETLLNFIRLKLKKTGMPRRYADYPDAFADWNYISSVGSYISVAGVVVFLINLLYSFITKKASSSNPWGEGATTLEWTVPSPPNFHTFDELPKVDVYEGAEKSKS